MGMKPRPARKRCSLCHRPYHGTRNVNGCTGFVGKDGKAMFYMLPPGAPAPSIPAES